MKKTRSREKPTSAETIARRADKGKPISHFFTNSGKMTKPIRTKYAFCIKYIRIMRSQTINQ